MTVGVGDVCVCGDIALPGQDMCAGCLADLQASRAQIDEQARAATEDHERRILDEEQAAA